MAHFNPDELEIMRVLWERGEAKPVEIQRALPHPVKNPALRWQLASLMERGHVSREKRGKAFHYRALTPRRSVFRKMVGSLSRVFAGGSSMALIGQMLEVERLSEEELEELKRLVASKAGGKGDSNQGEMA